MFLRPRAYQHSEILQGVRRQKIDGVRIWYSPLDIKNLSFACINSFSSRSSTRRVRTVLKVLLCSASVFIQYD